MRGRSPPGMVPLELVPHIYRDEPVFAVGTETSAVDPTDSSRLVQARLANRALLLSRSEDSMVFVYCLGNAMSCPMALFCVHKFEL
jgi:hypothetical protein